jgi:hypothetical protein
MNMDILARVPAVAKAGGDILAVAGWISVLAGALTQIFALAAAALSFAWAGARFYELVVRKRRCINAVDGCPAICPPQCQYFLMKHPKHHR